MNREMRVYHWLNLTNGLLALNDYCLPDYRLMRLQSTHCEQKQWDSVLASLPDELLFHLAKGDECRVYDYGANRSVPRAVWQGLEWAKYALHRAWWSACYQPAGRASSMAAYFGEQYQLLPRATVSRLKYYRPVTGAGLRLTAITHRTTMDGQKEWLFGLTDRGRRVERDDTRRSSKTDG